MLFTKLFEDVTLSWENLSETIKETSNLFQKYNFLAS